MLGHLKSPLDAPGANSKHSAAAHPFQEALLSFQFPWKTYSQRLKTSRLTLTLFLLRPLI